MESGAGIELNPVLARSVDDPDPRLPEMKQDAVRVIERQAAGIEILDRKAEFLISLGVAGLGGALAIGGFIGERSSAVSNRGRLAIFSFLFLGAVANLLAIGCFMQAFVGLRKARRRGDIPDPHWLAQRATEIGSLPSYHRSVVAGADEAFQENSIVSRRLVRARMAGVWLFFLALVLYVGSIMPLAYETLLR